MRLIRRLILLVVAVWLVAEVVAIPTVNAIAAHEVAAHTHDATTVHVSVGSFPIIARAFFLQKVSSVGVTLDRVVGQSLPFTTVRFDAKDVGIDRAAMLKGKFRVTSIESGTVTATIDLPAGVTGARIEGRTIMLGRVPIAVRSDLFPCTPTANVSGQQATLSCTFTGVPPVLRDID
jgi:hypothetical protein